MEVGAEPVVGSYEELLEAGIEGDIVFECSGESTAIEEGMRLTRPAGRLMVVGIPHPDHVTFDSTIPRRRELTVVFTRRSRDALAESVELVATGRVDLSRLPVRHYTLEQTAEALEATAARPGDMLRAIVTP
jgi:L-iditol 2-dehydrogenase